MLDRPPEVVAARPVNSAALARSLAVVALLLLSAVLAFRSRAPQESTSAVDPATPAELTVVAADIAAATAEMPEALSAVGAYVAESGVLVTVRLQGVAPSEIANWFSRIVGPFAGPLGSLPEGEAVVASFDLIDAPSAGRVLRFTAGQIPTPSAWRQFAVTGTVAAATGGDAGTSAATATSTTLPGEPVTPTTLASATTVAGQTGGGSTAAGGTPADSTPVTASTVSAGGMLVADDFAVSGDNWKPISGTWQVGNGVYAQTDSSGFDLISRLSVAVPAAFTYEVRLRAPTGPLNAGVVVAQPNPGTREGATVIDLTDGGSYVRWGRYAASGGAYEFVGGATISPALDPTQWHTLRVVVKGSTTIVFIDDVQIGDAGQVGAGGLGLVTSQSAVEFDDVKVTPG